MMSLEDRQRVTAHVLHNSQQLNPITDLDELKTTLAGL
jgi:hypothetical protein